MHKCADCGFLGLISIANGSYIIADYQYRTKGHYGGILTESTCGPQCLAFTEKLHNEQEKNITGEAVLAIIIRSRENCNFVQWRPGCTIKEHWEMLDRQEFLNWQARQRKEDKRWRIIELIVIGILTVVIAGGFTILGAFIERGSLFP